MAGVGSSLSSFEAVEAMTDSGAVTAGAVVVRDCGGAPHASSASAIGGAKMPARRVLYNLRYLEKILRALLKV
jgi:hypothetical protein